MLLNLLKGKIHCATVTEANLHYMGSITIDEALMEAAGILPNERVQVVDNNNGERLETYVIPGPRGEGAICLNGAAARCVQPGDIVIIMAYALFSAEEAIAHRPTVVMVDAKNRVKEVRRVEHHGEMV
ncbi:MAG: aspartate 1-decarboxylase [Negativicutes bacterium]